MGGHSYISFLLLFMDSTITSFFLFVFLLAIMNSFVNYPPKMYIPLQNFISLIFFFFLFYNHVVALCHSTSICTDYILAALITFLRIPFPLSWLGSPYFWVPHPPLSWNNYLFWWNTFSHGFLRRSI